MQSACRSGWVACGNHRRADSASLASKACSTRRAPTDSCATTRPTRAWRCFRPSRPARRCSRHRAARLDFVMTCVHELTPDPAWNGACAGEAQDGAGDAVFCCDPQKPFCLTGSSDCPAPSAKWSATGCSSPAADASRAWLSRPGSMAASAAPRCATVLPPLLPTPPCPTARQGRSSTTAGGRPRRRRTGLTCVAVPRWMPRREPTAARARRLWRRRGRGRIAG